MTSLVPIILLLAGLLEAASGAGLGTLASRHTKARWRDGATAIVKAAVQEGLANCAVTSFYDSQDGGAVVAQMARDGNFPRGAVMADVAGMAASDALTLVAMGSVGGVCSSLLLVVSTVTLRRLLEASLGGAREAWSGARPTLILLRPLYKGEEGDGDENIVMLHYALRKSVQLVIGKWVPNNDHCTLYRNILYHGRQRQSLKRVASFNGATGYRNLSDLYPSSPHVDLEGYVFTIAALPYSPFIMDSSLNYEGPGKYSGLEVRLIDTLAASANFSYVYKAPSDGAWGQRMDNGTWTGMIGLVDREEADWAVSDITFSPQRAQYVDFSRTFVYDASELLTPRALPLPRFLGPVKPFTLVVWVTVAASIALSGPVLFIIEKLSSNPNKKEWFVSVVNAAIYTVPSIFMQGCDVDVTTDSSRTFAIFWQLAAMTISIVYSSSLTSFLILPGFKTPIMNLEQLVKSDIGWAKVNFGGIQNAMLEQTRDPVLMKLRDGVKWRHSLDDILTDVVAGKLATWDNRITTRLKIAVSFTDKSGQPMMTLTGFELLQERIAWPMTRNGPFKARFDQLIDRARQAGLVNKWLGDVIREQQALAHKDGQSSGADGSSGGVVVLSLEHFQGAFFVLAFGYLLGSGAIVGELIQHRCRSKKTNFR